MGIREKMTQVAAREKLEEIKKAYANSIIGVTEDMLEQYQASDQFGVVKVTCRKPSSHITLGKPKANTDLTEEEKDFIEKRGSLFTMECFPVETKAIMALYGRVRDKRDKCSIGGSDNMGLIDFEKEFLPYLLKQKELLEEIKENIREIYDETVINHGKRVLSVARKLFPENISGITAEINWFTQRSVDEFLNSIKIELLTDFKEDLLGDEELKTFIREAKTESLKNTFVTILSGVYSEAWKALESYVIGIYRCQTSSLVRAESSRKNLNEAAMKLLRDTAPLKGVGGLDKIFEKMCHLAENIDDRDEAEDEFIIIFAMLYGSALSVGLTTLNFSKGKDALPSWLNISLIQDTWNEIKA